MKLCKKFLAMLMVFATIMSCLTSVSMASPASWNDLINDSFNSLNWTQINKMGWSTNRTDFFEVANDGTKEYMSIPVGEVTRTFSSAASTGKYEISYTLKVGSTDFLALMYASDKSTYLIMSQGKSGEINTKTWSTNQFGTLTDAQKNAWMTFKHIFDMTTGKYNVNVYDEQGNIVLSNTKEYDIALTDLLQFKLQNTGSSELQLKNFAIKQYVPSTDIISDNFDDYGSWADAKANGWKFNKANISVAGEAGAKYLSFSEGEVHQEFSISDGKYEISYSLKPGSAKPLVLLYNSANFHILSQCSEAGAVNTASWEGNVVANVDVNEWMTVKHIVDLDNNTATIKVYDNEGYLISNSTSEYALMNSLTDAAKLTIQNQKSKELLLDNVVIKQYEGETVDKVRLVNDTFDKISTQSDMTGWTIPNTSSATVTAYEENETETGKYVVLTGSNFKRAVEATSGMYKISYRLKPGEAKPIIYMSGTGTGNVLLTEVVNGKLVTNSWSAADMIEICALTDLTKWIDIEVIVDLDNTSMKIKAYDENGALIGSHERAHLQNVDKNAELTNFTSFNVDNWTTSAKMAFDNFVVEPWTVKPELDSDGVTIKNYKSETESLTSVCPAVKSITLDFGTVIDNESKALISITPSVNYTGEVIGNTYVMTFDNALSPNTTYTIYADAEIKTASGAAMGTGVNIEFTTRGAFYDIHLDSVEDSNGNTITNPALLSNTTVTINTVVANCTNEDKPLVYFVALYSGDRLANVYLNSGNLSVPTGAISAQPVEIEIGANANITRANVMLWNSIAGMVPYGTSIEIPNN